MVGISLVGAKILVSDVNTHSTPRYQDAKTFSPHFVQFLDIRRKGIPVTYLARVAIVLDIPIRWRSYNKMHASIRDLLHRPRVMPQKEPVGSLRSL